MIAHVSMPADDCERVARVLAAMLNGGALRFPPGGPDAWNVWSEGNTFQIVITPRGQVMVEGPTEVEWAPGSGAAERRSETHFAIAAPRPASEILAVAHQEGWHARICDRGGFFGLVEVWVENAYLVEVLDPAQLADYRSAMTMENWRDVFALE